MRLKYSDINTTYGLQLPKLAETFEQVLSISPNKRLKWAKEELHYIYRDGWFVNTPVGKNGDAETVHDHVKHLIQLIDDYFPAKDKELAKAYVECHDDHETIAHAVIEGIKRDLNPRFNKMSYQISDEDKEAIENLAAEIIIENEPERMKLLLDFKEGKKEVAIKSSGMDKVCPMWKCVGFVESGKYNYSDFRAYWDYWTPENADKRLPPPISSIYKNELYPEIQKLSIR
jgi:5'-deoxynucleotidase YfbR-like HD superfamily hydrolase